MHEWPQQSGLRVDRRGCPTVFRQGEPRKRVVVSENRDLAGEALQGLVCETSRCLFNLTAEMCSELFSHYRVYFSSDIYVL
jgi:hypothetical protein